MKTLLRFACGLLLTLLAVTAFADSLTYDAVGNVATRTTSFGTTTYTYDRRGLATLISQNPVSAGPATAVKFRSIIVSATPGIGLIFFIFSYAAQYSSVRRILSSSIRPTSLETEVFSSAAFFRAHFSASSCTVMVTFFNTKSV